MNKFETINENFYKYNVVGELNEYVADSDKVFIKYADDDFGKNMTDVYNNHKYIGTYIGKEQSNNPEDYIWKKMEYNPDTRDHSKLDNLDYEHSGHIGFASEKELENYSKIEDLPKSLDNDEIDKIIK